MDLRKAAMVRPGGSATDASKSWLLAIASALIDVHGSKTRDGLARHVEVFGVDLNANALEPQRASGGPGGAGAHERVQNHAFSQGQRGAHKLAQELLWLQGGMGRQGMLWPSRRQGINQVAKRFLRGDAPEAARPPLAKIVLHPSLARFAEEPPRFPA